MAAAMYLLTNSGATDAQLYVEYMRDFSWALDGGMSDLARQANGALAGERMGDFLAMAAGGFGSDGPDFGRADRYEQEMQAWSDAFKVKDKKPSLEELFGRKPSVPDLGETDLGKLPVNLPSQNEPIYNQSGSMANTSEPAIQQVVVKGVKAESDQTYENYDPISPSLSPSQYDYLWNSYAGPVTRRPKTKEELEAERKADAEQRVANVLKYLDQAKEAVGDTGWDPLLLLAMATRESSGNPEAGKNGAYKGLVQLGASTWKEAVSKEMIYLASYVSYENNWDDPLANLSVAATALEIKKIVVTYLMTILLQ
jgi:hypothetical protein